MPMNGYFKELLELYPKALVVLTEHPTGSAERWANSVRATIGRNAELFPQKPFAWIPFMKGFVRMEAWAWQAQGAPRRKGSPPAFDAAAWARRPPLTHERSGVVIEKGLNVPSTHATSLRQSPVAPRSHLAHPSTPGS